MFNSGVDAIRYTLIVRWTGERFEVTVPELGEGAKAPGATQDKALKNGQRLIVQAQMAEAMRVHSEQKTVV